MCEQMALGAYCAVSRFCSGLGLFPEEAYAGGVGYPPCLAGEESPEMAWKLFHNFHAISRILDTTNNFSNGKIMWLSGLELEWQKTCRLQVL